MPVEVGKSFIITLADLQLAQQIILKIQNGGGKVALGYHDHFTIPQI